MTTGIVERTCTAEAHSDGYGFTRCVDIGGRVVRATLTRDVHEGRSRAQVEVLDDDRTWTHLAEEPTSAWWAHTPPPRLGLDDAVAVLTPVTDRLLARAADILAPPTTAPVPPTVSASPLSVSALPPRLREAVSALLLITYGSDAEGSIGPEDIAQDQACSRPLHVIEFPDGSVVFTKAHRPTCPFITSAEDCDKHQCSPHHRPPHRTR
ncbi:hypothetical protein UO65_0156 [Actinokineospora spheciospongiae]|uniref:Uncharacterized protein n=1 Tax=Actinokineospora spheciospongiae TaxID=909613 RepID=W7JEX1_9PSEU|nr:hypothetical protein [Actinokineospora spheciospongiae]EWC64549.1 hypothetical protein UO65_0156 [Actinokineospora spheciospongiae]